MKRCALVLFAAFGLAACHEGPTQGDSDRSSPLFLIKDAVHGGGNAHFFWLPPMVPDPNATGVFDGTLAPEVEICEITLAGLAGCVPLTPSAVFTTTTGPGSETVRVNLDDQYYIVNWHTNEFDVGPDPTYRISVLVDDTELGLADVQLGATGKDAKNLANGNIIGLKDGRTLPIKFRIEEGALAPADPPTTVFLLFDGVTLLGSNTTDDATTNTSALVQANPTVIGPFDAVTLSDAGGLTRQEIIATTVAQLRAIHAPYNIAFTTTRPASGEYQMVVFGGTCASVIGQNGCAGIALPDCGNVLPNNITFVFPAGLRVEDLAVVVARENAIALGLGHTDNPLDVMFPVIQGTVPNGFAAGNIPDGSGCPATATFQDSHQRMLEVLGAS